MKKIMNAMLLILMSISITGCSKANYQKDESYETDIIGTYEMTGTSEGESIPFLTIKYSLNQSNSFKYFYKENERISESNGNFIIKSITDEISKINFNIENTKVNSNKSLANVNSAKMSSQIYKYKNMLGYVYETNDIPKSKTFDYVIYDTNEKNSGLVFTEDGYTHGCSDIANCQCSYAKDVQYIRKNDIIYWHSNGVSNQNYWTIAYYITDIGLFQPLVYKIKEK